MEKKYYPYHKATIRKIDGYVVESLSEPSRKEMVTLMDRLEQEGKIHVYGLRHRENDWSYPHFIYERRVLVNRFGWFITINEPRSVLAVKPTSKKTKHDCTLTSRNADIDFSNESNLFDILEKL